jgi:heme b synthase
MTPPLRLVAWEVTRSCNLACRHCRAEAHPEPYPGELDNAQAGRLIDSFAELGSPLIILTGGEPLLRPDVFELAAHARKRGLRCVMAPNGTLINADSARRMRAVGIGRCAISLDGPDAASHDAFRGVAGAFAASLRGIEFLKQAGVGFQVNTTVTAANLHTFKNIFQLAQELGAEAWHIFLLVPMGRAASLRDQVITARQYEEALNWLYDFRKGTDMHLKATCAPHYYRILRQRAGAEGLTDPDSLCRAFGMDALTRGCLGGIGFCFVSQIGQVQPCGYLELNCGNVLDRPFPEIWRDAKVFRQLRDQGQYQGKCGVCEYHRFCGGCRARALSLGGDYLGPEPLCAYSPGAPHA